MRLVLAQSVIAFDKVRLKVGRLLVHTANQVEQSDLPKLGRMAFRLERDVAFAQKLSVPAREFFSSPPNCGFE